MLSSDRATEHFSRRDDAASGQQAHARRTRRAHHPDRPAGPRQAPAQRCGLAQSDAAQDATSWNRTSKTPREANCTAYSATSERTALTIIATSTLSHGLARDDGDAPSGTPPPRCWWRREITASSVPSTTRSEARFRSVLRVHAVVPTFRPVQARFRATVRARWPERSVSIRPVGHADDHRRTTRGLLPWCRAGVGDSASPLESTLGAISSRYRERSRGAEERSGQMNRAGAGQHHGR